MRRSLHGIYFSFKKGATVAAFGIVHVMLSEKFVPQTDKNPSSTLLLISGI
jgi:hypothetical protein